MYHTDINPKNARVVILVSNIVELITCSLSSDKNRIKLEINKKR